MSADVVPLRTDAARPAAPVEAPLLAVEGLRKSFGASAAIEVLAGIGFKVGAGEFVSVVGPSGCGKTTLLLTLSGLLRPDAGDVRFAGHSVRGGTPAGLAIVFQDYSRSLFPWKTNLGNVLFGMRRISGGSAAERAEQARGLLAAVGLSGFEQHYPWQVSGGMQQRVAIARGLASQSRLLLLDEPLASVDAQTRADMQDLLLGIAQRYGQTCVLVTHDVEEAVYMGDRIVVLSNRPTHVVREIVVPLPRPRDQITTRESTDFLDIRHEVLALIRRERHPEGGAGPAP
ncbi:MAG TPA: ABC transporter ATP-binding protein [Hyphomicrobiales bacterium]|nr:ABC transporter ATP-binding protein [Hyphomicrobiales bacterium]